MSVSRIWIPDAGNSFLVLLCSSDVSCGKSDLMNKNTPSRLDLNAYLTQHPGATYYIRANGNSMAGRGIHNNDLLVVDCATEIASGDVVVAVIGDEYVVKEYVDVANNPCLMSDNGVSDPIERFEIWGKVIYVIHSL